MFKLKSKRLPDTLKLINDIKLYLKPIDISPKFKDYYLMRMMKELTNLLKTYREFQPYFRKELCLLRKAVKYFDVTGESAIRFEAENLKHRLDRLSNWKTLIIRKGQEILGKNTKLLFCCIDEGIRIGVTDKPINITQRMNEARVLKSIVLGLTTPNLVSSDIASPLSSLVQGIVLLLSLDGLTGLKMKSEVSELVMSLINTEQNDPELLEKLKDLNIAINLNLITARGKRDETEKALNEIYRTMLYLDRQADLMNRIPTYAK